MFYVREDDTYVVRFEDGEVFPGRFLEFLSARELTSGSFIGIGAMKRTTIAFFDTGTKEYLDRELDEQMEVLAIVGNVALHAGKPLVHAHIVLGRSDYSVVGGHLREGIVRPTLELTLRAGSEPLQRAVDPKYGLPALELKEHF
ncbi:MAG: DNA-binding protein [Gemmatimonadota bacterium]|nr:MAG: DNA-binding protein [Gemmatimonadota bacterium]